MTPIPPEIVERLAAARAVTVLTGAGISPESGIPTFRAPGGWWRNLDPMKLATPEAFRADPHLVWEFYDHRREGVAKAQPNPGHATLVAMEAAYPRFTLVTQNVDGLHRLAGSKNVIELHGDMWAIRCSRCGVSRQDRTVPLRELPPVCKLCGALERPGVVWFGEALPPGAMERALEAAAASDVVLVVGTSAVVYPAASLAPAAANAGALVVEINIERAAEFHGMETLLGPSGQVLPELWAAVSGQRTQTAG